MHRSLDKRLSALEQQRSIRPIFVQFGPPRPRYVAEGRAVDGDTFARLVASAGRAAMVIRVMYGAGSILP
jgi:hypothetical protein